MLTDFAGLSELIFSAKSGHKMCLAYALDMLRVPAIAHGR